MLPGCWFGQPQHVAYIAPAEESIKYIVKPGLRAAGADMRRIYFPEVWLEGDQVRLLSVADEERLHEQFAQHEITVIIVDPLMDTIGAGVDINRNNGVRAALGPWMRMADCLEGVAIGVAHLKKAVISFRRSCARDLRFRKGRPGERRAGYDSGQELDW